MSSPTVYRLINKSNNTVDFYRDPNAIAAYLLGRRISNFLVIKSDDTGDRLVPLIGADVLKIALDLENG